MGYPTSDRKLGQAHLKMGQDRKLGCNIYIYIYINIDGLLIVVDYSKAFDTIEWSDIDQCLNRFNFGDKLISWVQLLRSRSVSRVEQNWHFTSIFELSRGCRQGDPISPYTQRALYVQCTYIVRTLYQLYVQCTYIVRTVPAGYLRTLRRVFGTCNQRKF